MANQTAPSPAQAAPASRFARLRSLNMRIALLVTFFSLLTALPMAYLAGQRLQAQALGSQRALQQELTSFAAREIAQPMKLGFSGSVEKHIAQVITRAGDSFAYARAVKADGVPMFEAGTAPAAETYDLEAHSAETLTSGTGWRSADGHALVLPVLSSKGAIRGTLVMVWDPAPLLAGLRAGMLRDAATGALMLAASLLGCLVILSRLLRRPLLALAAALERISAGDYDTPLPMAQRRDELGRIAQRIAQLQQTLAEGRRSAQTRAQEQRQQAQAVDQLRAGLDALARRDLSHQMQQQLAPTYEPLRQDFNTALSSSAAMIGQVVGTAAAILHHSSQISHSSTGLSQRITAQSDSLAQLSQALTSLTASLARSADGVRAVNGLAAEAVDEASASSAVVENAVGAMTGIEQSAGRIETITEVIDDIAFQTNLLALNAGVEAARAGEAGKGFAVVAAEVQALAQRSSSAATEIKALISSTTQHIAIGVSEVNNTGAVLRQIITRMSEISTHVSSAATGFSHDSQQLEGLTQQLGQLGATTRDNTALVSGTVQAVMELRADATRLSTQAAAFQLPAQTLPRQQPPATAA